MEFRKIGKSDLKASVIGFGTIGISGEYSKTKPNDNKMIKILKEAQALGINLYDTAPAYNLGHAEELLGKAFKRVRSRVLIATKCGVVVKNGGQRIDLSSKSIKKEINESLKRLQTDYIDLYQAHWPDPNTPIEETFLTLNELKKYGKIRYIGICNYSVSLIEEALKYSEIISSENLYNILQRNSDRFFDLNLIYHTENEILPFCQKKNLGFFPFNPFFKGLLTGKRLKVEDFEFEGKDARKNDPELIGEKLIKNLELVKKLLKFSEKINKPLTQLVINWLIKDKRITSVIAGPMNISEVKDNVASIHWKLDDELYNEMNNLITK